MEISKRWWIGVFLGPLCFLLGGISQADTKPTLVPLPHVVKWLKGTGAVGNVTIEYDSDLRSPQAEALFKKFAKSLPNQHLPSEGFLLQVQPRGAFLLAKDKRGEIYGRQILEQLKLPDGSYPQVQIADWPDQAWRGIHFLDSGSDTLPKIKVLIHDVLSKNRCNMVIYEIDYHYWFDSHPEIKQDKNASWNKAQVRELVQAFRDEGIKVIPEINCLGHQSWQLPPDGLLKAHPEFEEIPDASPKYTDLNNKEFYCRSWCPLHPKLNPTMFDLFDELIDAFQTDTFHVGMDEVFVIGSKKCPRCKDKNTADIFAGQVTAFHDYFQKKGVTMMMWGDRLLDSKMVHHVWEGSDNGTSAAIDRVPKDIILCDWHYEFAPAGGYPSAKYLTDKGFHIWPTVFRRLPDSVKFMETARDLKSPYVLGTLASVWFPAAQMLENLSAPAPTKATPTAVGQEEKRDAGEIARTAVKDLRIMWNFKEAPALPKEMASK